MKITNRIMYWALLVLSSVLFFSCGDDYVEDHGEDPLTPPVTTLNQVTASFSKDTVDVAVGKTYKQSVTTNCPNAYILYFSSDQSVATVDSVTGEVTALSKGNTTITATVRAPKDSEEYEGTSSSSYQINVDYNKLGTVKIGFRASFSPDLLDLVTPIVIYRDKDGEHEVRLNKETCEHVKEDHPFGNETIVYDAYSWESSIVSDIYETIDFDETVFVRFESNKQTVDENRKYDLYASVGVGSVDKAFSYNGTSYIGSSTYISADIKISIGDGEPHDGNIYEGESVQKFIEEMVKTQQEFRVEVSKDGKVKVNGK